MIIVIVDYVVYLANQPLTFLIFLKLLLMLLGVIGIIEIIIFNIMVACTTRMDAFSKYISVPTVIVLIISLTMFYVGYVL